MMQKIDLKKECKHLYKPYRNAALDAEMHF
jgi:hypothetical protein